MKAFKSKRKWRRQDSGRDVIVQLRMFNKWSNINNLYELILLNHLECFVTLDTESLKFFFFVRVVNDEEIYASFKS